MRGSSRIASLRKPTARRRRVGFPPAVSGRPFMGSHGAGQGASCKEKMIGLRACVLVRCPNVPPRDAQQYQEEQTVEEEDGSDIDVGEPAGGDWSERATQERR